jgi:hypothetical protein
MIETYNISVSDESAVMPVTLAEAKAWAVVDHDDHDELLTDMIRGATDDIEQYLNVKLRPATVSFHMMATKSNSILYQLPYVMDLNHIGDLVVSTATDGEAAQEMVLDTDYYINGALKVVSSGTSKVGYTVVPVVPTGIKEAIKMLVAYRYNNRGDQEKQQGIPEDIQAKINRYRKVWL